MCFHSKSKILLFLICKRFIVEGKSNDGYDYWNHPIETENLDQKFNQRSSGNELDASWTAYNQYDQNDKYPYYEDYHQALEHPTKALSTGSRNIVRRQYSLNSAGGNFLGLPPVSVFGLVLSALVFGGLILLLSNEIEALNKDKPEPITSPIIATTHPTTTVQAIHKHIHKHDPCHGIDCGKSGTCVKGVCRCGANARCEGNSDTCVSGVCKCGHHSACGGYHGSFPPIDNICTDGVCLCGRKEACNVRSAQPACRATNGAPASHFDSRATCQCFRESCHRGFDSNATSPFCGNEASASNGKNMVQIGVCGKCQPLPAGGGGESTCTSSTPPQIDAPDCTTKNTCPLGLVCCKTGECVSPKKPPMKIGENCP